MSLETRAIHWLLYEGRCHYAVCERSPRKLTGEPDVLGVRAGRRLVEIEVKRSISDFKANAGKRHVAQREMYLQQWPYQFYFLVPEALVAKIQPLLPSYAGLMSDTFYYVRVHKVAPVNKESRRLTVSECVRLARCMANHSASLMKRNDEIWNSLEWKHSHVGADYVI